MRLTKYQKARLLEFNWDVVETENGENCIWINLNKENNKNYNNIIKLFGLTEGSNNVNLLVVATSQTKEE